jgi:nitrite transporter
VLTIPEAVDAQADAAHHKVDLLATPALLLVRTMLAGAFIGIGVLIMATAGGPLVVAGSPFAPLVQGLVFGVALTIVVVAGAELATSAMMILTQGVMRGTVGAMRAGVTLLAVLVGNLLGSIVFATLVHLSGVLAPGTAGGAVIAGMVEHKAAETNGQLVVRGILCNLLVCLAIWCAGRLRSEGARIAVVFACVMVFITSGFEHVVANMTTFSLGILGGLPGATVAELGRNILAVGFGNLLGGAVLVGAAYAYGTGRRATQASHTTAVEVPLRAGSPHGVGQAPASEPSSRPVAVAIR